MKYIELFLALRFLRPTRSYVSFITMLSMLGVILSVTVLIVVLSVMEGFQQELRNKVVGFSAHITIVNDGILGNHAQIIEKFKADRRIAAASPFVMGPVLAEYNGRISTPFIRGVIPDEADQVTPLRKHLMAGNWLQSPDEILVGRIWAKKNDAAIGDKILIHSPRNLQNLLPQKKEKEQAFYLPSEYRIAGIFSTDLYDYDANFLLIHLSEAQQLYNLADSVHGISVRLHQLDDAEAVKSSLNRWLEPPETALTWMDQNKQLFSAIEVEKVTMSFCLFFIMLVAAFGICSTLITIMVQKAREIGLMKALGARNAQIAAIFTLYGLIVGLVGSTLGVSCGLLALHYRNDFRHWLAGLLGVELFPPSVYHFPEIPAVINWPFIYTVAALGVLLSTLAALFPALRAAQAEPVQTLRQDT